MAKIFYSMTMIMITIGFLSSCSSVPIEIKKKDGINDEDFNFQMKYVYKRNKDKHEISLLKNANDVLLDESFAKLNLKQLYAFDKKEQRLSQLLAFCYMGHIGSAMNGFKKDYKKSKGNPVYWHSLATCYLLNKEYDKAKLYFQTASQFYQKATKSKKDYIPSLHNLGLYYAFMGDDRRALQAFKNIISQEPKNKVARFNLAQLYLKYGMAAKSLKEFDWLSRRNAKDHDVLAGLAISSQVLGDFDLALKLYQQLPKDMLAKPYIALNFANLWVAMKKPVNARKALAAIKSVKRANDKKYYARLEKYLINEEVKARKLKKKQKDKTKTKKK